MHALQHTQAPLQPALQTVLSSTELQCSLENTPTANASANAGELLLCVLSALCVHSTPNALQIACNTHSETAACSNLQDTYLFHSQVQASPLPNSQRPPQQTTRLLKPLPTPPHATHTVAPHQLSTAHYTPYTQTTQQQKEEPQQQTPTATHPQQQQQQKEEPQQPQPNPHSLLDHLALTGTPSQKYLSPSALTTHHL